MKFTPASSRMMLAVTTWLGFAETSMAATPAASSVATRPPATCW